MKKFILGFLTGAMIFCAAGAFAVSYVADVAGFKVLVNGEEFVSDPPALVVEGRTYLPLRAVGDALGVPVNWNAELGQAEVGTAPSYLAQEVNLDGVSAEFKLFMDECEVFFDDYVEFIEKYAKTEGAGDEMMADYNAYMEKYNALMAKLETLDEESMTQDDIAYYAQVMTRISEKLASVAQQ